MPATTAVTVRAASCGGPSPVTGGPPAEPVVHLGAARDGGLQLAETRPGQPVQGGEVARHAHFPAAQLRLDQPGVLQVQHRGADRRPVPGGFGGQGGQAQEDAGAVQVGGVAEDPGDMFQRGRAQPGPISAGAGPAAARIVTPPRRGARRVLHGLQPRELVSEPPVRPRPASRSQHPAPPLQPGSLWPPGPPPAKGGNHRRPRGSQKLIIERRGWPAVKARPDRRPRPSSRPPSATAGRPTGGRSCGTAGPAPRPGPPAPPMASASPPAAPPPGPRTPRNRPTRPAPPAWPAATGAASPPATGAASLPALPGRFGPALLRAEDQADEPLGRPVPRGGLLGVDGRGGVQLEVAGHQLGAPQGPQLVHPASHGAAAGAGAGLVTSGPPGSRCPPSPANCSSPGQSRNMAPRSVCSQPASVSIRRYRRTVGWLSPVSRPRSATLSQAPCPGGSPAKREITRPAS